MIYTVTFNPALDYVVFLDNLKLGDVNRSTRESIFYGGKGINVSTILNTLGLETTALGFVAGFTGKAIEDGLAAQGIHTDFIHLPEGNSRINVKVKHGDETEINGQGPVITEEAINELFAKLDTLTKEDILVLAGADRSVNNHIKLDYLQVTSGVGVRSVASLGLNIAGEHFEAAASGNGPVDAAITALKKIIDRHMVLKEFTIQAISKGSDDMGKVHMQVEYDGQMYYGFGANTDIIAASVEAYIDCINKFKR